ncbi:MAG: phosphoenolpyruvate--protein phosphotransferase [Elusimicrobiota bacterium]|jgi:phosphoenolpyruvate-protein phosphotransferase|nr:phosphoenolpyruvate--protein phosphotransferase [Elusimicrobiota bacterium]
METDINLSVFSPVSGAVVPLSEVPDPVFAEKMLGDGLAVKPSSDFIYAPFDGVVKTLHKAFHAVVIESKGIEVLVHIGVETVNMKGEGFSAFITAGQQVKQGDKLIGFDRDLISKKAVSNLVVVIVSNRPEVELNKTEAGRGIRAGQFLFSLGTAAAPAQEEASSKPEDFALSAVITVKNKNGFHARPASLIAKLAAGFAKTEVQIIKGPQRANAKSMVEIMGLSIDYDDNIQVAAAGADKEAALKAVSEAILEGLNEGGGSLPAGAKQNYDFTKELEFYGVPAYPGLVIGKTFVMKKQDIDVEENAADPAAQAAKLRKASADVKAALGREIAAAKGAEQEILRAHLEMLEDPFLLETAADLIKRGKSAGFAWRAAVKKSIEKLDATGNELLRERADDYKNAEARVLFELTGKKYEAPVFPKDSIVIVKDLLAYELGFFNGNVAGLVMAGGSPTSHVAIMLKNMGLASILGTGEAVLDIPAGRDIILNSELGKIKLNPSDIEEVKKQQSAREAARAVNLRHAMEPAITRDGFAVTVKGNVGSLEEAVKAAEKGSEGIGLVRTEFLFAGSEAPSEAEQYELYQKITDSQRGSPVIIRTLDVGGDKPLAYIDIPREANPIMGLRGVRNYKLNLELFKAQARAIMRVNPQGAAQIMLPMVGFTDEIITYKQIVAAEQEKLGIKKVSFGIMVEVPSAALLAAEFAKHVDFFSIGTNDLTQYALAIDRGHGALSPLADTLNPAVLRLIKMTAEGAAQYKKSVGVCGAAASDITAVPVLLGLGIRDLSVVGGLIPDVKAFIRTLSMDDCKEAAAAALTMQEARQTREIVKSKFKL